MKKLIYVGVLLLGLLGIMPAFASPILSVVPSSTSTSVGATFSVDIVMSGLRSGGVNEIVSAYDLALAYDPTIITPLPLPAGSGSGFVNPTMPAWVQFSGALDVPIPTGGPSLKFYNRNFQTTSDWSTYYAAQVPAPNTAAVEFGEVSFDPSPYAELFAQQGDIVTLATLTFTALRKGVTDLLLIDDSYRRPPPIQSGNQLDVKGSTGILDYAIIDGTVNVPEPSTLSLLAAGLFGAGGIFRRKMASRKV